jgi:hypothetical protein
MSWKGDPTLRKLLVPIDGLAALASAASPEAIDLAERELSSPEGQRKPVVLSDDGGVVEGIGKIHVACRDGWTYLAATLDGKESLDGQVGLFDDVPRADPKLIDTLRRRRAKATIEGDAAPEELNARSSQVGSYAEIAAKAKTKVYPVVITVEAPEDFAELRAKLGSDHQDGLLVVEKEPTSAAEWVGLPRFVPYRETYRETVVCESEDERKRLLADLGIETIHKGTRGTLSVWYPERSKKDLASLRFVSDDSYRPRYPIYVPSRRRSDTCFTAVFLERDRVDYWLVVEEWEQETYERRFPGRTLVLPERDQGLIYARNWIRDHAEASGAARHWQLDDNISLVRRLYAGERLICDSGPAFRAVEDFVDRYSNVAVAGLNYQMFVTPPSPPYRTNVHVYSATLVNHAAPFRWRLLYNDDTDLCLQALAGGWTTVLANLFMADKKTTMTVKGGNTDAGGPINYQGDGRLRMARVLEEKWPGVVTVDERYGRAQHVVDWGRFKTPLKLREGILPSALAPNEYGLSLRAIRPVASASLRRLFEEAAA